MIPRARRGAPLSPAPACVTLPAMEPGHYDDATLSVGPVSIPETDPDDLEARAIGHFAVLRRLGEGGMGVVYAA